MPKVPVPSRSRRARFLTSLTCLAGVLLGSAYVVQGDDTPDPRLSGGNLTVARLDRDAYLQPAPGLSITTLREFERGRHHFDKKWASISSLQFEWGLGPTYIAMSCAECHVGGGRGRPPEGPRDQLFSVLVRLSVPGEGEHGSPRPHPAYGDQFQNRALQGPFPDFAYHTSPVPPEAELYLDWDEQTVTLGDGETVRLRKPKLRVEALTYGELGDGTMTSIRIAQPMVGLGLLQAVPDEALIARAARQKTLGVDGRVNHVWDGIGKRIAVGRFGWKANQPSIRQQIAAASLGDMGLTSPLYRDQNCPAVQVLCAVQTPGNDPELVTTDWDELEFWTLALAVPARRRPDDPVILHGEKKFTEARCDACHQPEMRTADEFPAMPPLARQTFHAYTDLLLHDMGEGLADGRPDFEARGRDWRTPALWGLGLSATVNGSSALLHDGRARNVTEAILWHGGEAASARDAFRRMPRADREALLAFVDSI